MCVPVAVERQGQLAGEAVLVEDQRVGGQPDLAGRAGAAQLVEILLDPAVGGAEVLGQQPGLLPVAGEEVAGEMEAVLVAAARRGSGPPSRPA